MVSFLYFNMNRIITTRDYSKYEDSTVFVDIIMDNLYAKKLILLCEDFYFMKCDKSGNTITTVVDNIKRNIDNTIYNENNIPVGVVEDIYIINTTTGHHLQEVNHWEYRKYEEKIYKGEYHLLFNIMLNDIDFINLLSKPNVINSLYIIPHSSKGCKNIKLTISFLEDNNKSVSSLRSVLNNIYSMIRYPFKK